MDSDYDCNQGKYLFTSLSGKVADMGRKSLNNKQRGIDMKTPVPIYHDLACKYYEIE